MFASLFCLSFLHETDAKKGRDFYKILGLTKKEVMRSPKPESVVKKAFRKLSLKWHPDKCKDKKEKCLKKFTDINDAHEVLCDKKKREDFNNYGEEVPGSGGGHGGGGGSPFEEMFGDFFGGGDGFGFGGDPFGGGGGRGGGQQHRSIFKGSDVLEWSETQFDEMIANQNVGEFHVVVFYQSTAADGVKDSVLELHKTYNQFMTIAAVNCKLKGSSICGSSDREKINVGQSAKLVIYWKNGDKKQQRKRYSGNFQGRTLMNWVANSIPDVTREFTSMKNVRKWGSEENAGKVILFTDKNKPPPMIKVFANQFVGKIDVGIVKIPKDSLISANPVVKYFGVDKTPALLFISNKEKLRTEPKEGEEITKERSGGESFTSRMDVKLLGLFFARVVTNHRKETVAVKLRELTEASHGSGQCGQTVAHFCLVYVGIPNQQRTQELTIISQKLKDDHVKVYWFDPSKWAGLKKEVGDHPVILWRPKRRRWKGFEVDEDETPILKNPKFIETIVDWASNTVSGGSALPNTFKLKTRDEL